MEKRDDGAEGEERGSGLREAKGSSRRRSVLLRWGLASAVCFVAAQGAAGCDSDGADSGDGGAGGDRDPGSMEPGEAGSGGGSSGGNGSGGTAAGGTGGDVAGAAGMGGGCSDCCDPEDPPCEEDWELVCYNDWNVTHYCCNETENTRTSCEYDGDFYDYVDDLCICDAPVWPPVPF